MDVLATQKAKAFQAHVCTYGPGVRQLRGGGSGTDAAVRPAPGTARVPVRQDDGGRDAAASSAFRGPAPGASGGVGEQD